MQIHLQQPGQPIADFSIAGSTVTVAGISIDCAARQQDVPVHIEVRQNQHGPGEGGNGAFLAQIRIPARRFETVQIQPQESTGEAGSMNQPTERQEPLPLDPRTVVITLWPAA